MPRTPVEVAKHYAELFNAGKHAEMGLLYAPDSLWSRPGTPDVRGGENIAAHYASPEHAAGTSGMKITSERYFADGANAVAAEFVFEGNGHSSHVIDLFEVDEQGPDHVDDRFLPLIQRTTAAAQLQTGARSLWPMTKAPITSCHRTPTATA